MGMTEMFSEYADLSGLTSEPVTVADVVHKAYISVSEGGSEAAAASGNCFWNRFYLEFVKFFLFFIS